MANKVILYFTKIYGRFIWKIKVNQIIEDTKGYREFKIKHTAFSKLKNYNTMKKNLELKSRELKKKKLINAIHQLYEYYRENVNQAEKEQQARRFYYRRALSIGFHHLRKYLNLKKLSCQKELEFQRYYDLKLKNKFLNEEIH